MFLAESGHLPVNDGKRQRTFALLKALSAQYEIDFLILNNRQDFLKAKEDTNIKNVNFLECTYQSRFPFIDKVGKWVGLLFRKQKKVVEFISDQFKKSNYCVVFSRYLRPVINVPNGSRIICDIDDDFTEVYRSRIKAAGSIWKKIRYLQIFLLNYPLYKKQLARVEPIQVKGKEGFILPNLPFQMLLADKQGVAPSTVHDLLYVGKLSYKPNMEGLLWFLEEVWPQVIKKGQGLRLSVVSSVLPGQLLMHTIEKAEGVSYLGRVESLSEEYKNHSMVVAPVFSGGGSNIKVSEALLMGRGVVTTSFGVKGFEKAEELGYIKTADSPEGFAQNLLDSMKDSEKMEKLQQEIAHWAGEYFSYEDWAKSLLDFIDEKVK